MENTPQVKEETSQEGQQAPVAETNKEAPQISKIEQQALDMGWRPLEEFNGDPEDFIDAKEFVRRAPLFEKIEKQSKELKAVRVALDSFKEHYSKVKEVEFDRAMKRLKEEQKQALIDQDPDRFYAIEAARETIQKEKDEFAKTQEDLKVKEEVPVHPMFQTWVNRNPWYQNKPYMKQFADEVGSRLAGRMSPEEVLKEVEKQVREEFPNQFRNPNRDKPGTVEDTATANRSSSNTGSNLAAFEKTLSEDERRVMQNLVRGGHITKEAYLKDLKAIKGN